MKEKKLKILEIDPGLMPYEGDLKLRMQNYENKKAQLLSNAKSLNDFANGHKFFGFHRTESGWVYREWAPAAESMFLTGDFNNWDTYGCPMQKLDNGLFDIYIMNVKVSDRKKL